MGKSKATKDTIKCVRHVPRPVHNNGVSCW